MNNEPFLLVSLEETESKQLAQAITNKSARKILDFLSKEDSSTETIIAKKLKIPLSTVHYNLQALTKANLVEAEEFHYSEKGKEVLHYKLANKLIIIAPKKINKESFMEKLKGIIPVGLIALATAAIIQFLSKTKFGLSKSFAASSANSIIAQDTLMKTTEEAAPRMMDAAVQEGGAVLSSAPVPEAISVTATEPNIALWFLIGAGFVILLLIIWYWFVTRKKKK